MSLCKICRGIVAIKNTPNRTDQIANSVFNPSRTVIKAMIREHNKMLFLL